MFGDDDMLADEKRREQELPKLPLDKVVNGVRLIYDKDVDMIRIVPNVEKP